MYAATVRPAVSLCGTRSALSSLSPAATTSTAGSFLPGNATPLDFRLECASFLRVEHFVKSRSEAAVSQAKWCTNRGSVQVRTSAANVEQAQLAGQPLDVAVEAEVKEAAEEQQEIESAVEKVEDESDGAIVKTVVEQGAESGAREADSKEETVEVTEGKDESKLETVEVTEGKDESKLETVEVTEGKDESKLETVEVTEGAKEMDENPPKVKLPTEAKLKRRAADWGKAENLRTAGSIHEGKVEACNSGGLIVRYMSLLGFLPMSQLDPSRVPADKSKKIFDIAKEMVGQNVKVKITESNEETRRLLFSEKEAAYAQTIREIIEGDVLDGVVNGVTDYGAFVNLKLPDATCQVSGLVHVSELSWDMVRDPKDVIQVGQAVKVKVVSVDRNKGRLALSIKQLQADPLFETLDTLMPVESPAAASTPEDSSPELPDTPLPGLEQICDELLKEEGISAVTPGRQKNEKRVVSQDLELWVSNERVEDGSFTLLARAGRLVQEVHVTTSLDKEGIKAAVQRVTGRVE